MKSEPNRPPASKRGRRPRGAVSREEILHAATELFGEYGYQETTNRKIGEVAGVDTKLVHYYFGTKEELFATAITEAFRSRGFPEFLTEASLKGDGSPGERYLGAILSVLEEPGLGVAFVGLIRNLGTHEESRQLFLRFITNEVLGRMGSALHADNAQVRLTLMGSQVLGLVMARYVVKVEPLASLPAREVARMVGPTLDRYLLGDIGVVGD